MDFFTIEKPTKPGGSICAGADAGIRYIECGSCGRSTQVLRERTAAIEVLRYCPEDIMWGGVFGFIVAEGMAHALREEKLSGVEYHEVLVEYYYEGGVMMPGHEFPDRLVQIHIIGRGGSVRPESLILDEDGNTLDLSKRCPRCGIPGNLLYLDEVRKAVISLDEWDGSDFFFVTGLGEVMTEKAMQVLLERGVKNWVGEPVETK